MPFPSEVYFQFDMFTQDWVDTRTEVEKQRDAFQVMPQQLELFPAHVWWSLFAKESAPAVTDTFAETGSNRALMLSPVREITVFESTSLSTEHLHTAPLQLPAPPTLLLLGSGIPHRTQLDNEYFVERLSAVKPRLDAYVLRRWYGDFDVFERDNLVQAGLVYLWRAFQREGFSLAMKNDSYWLGVAKHGALCEIRREYRTRFRQQGKRGARRKKELIVVSAEDQLQQRYPEARGEDLDLALLSSDTLYRSDTPQIIAADHRMDVAFLVEQILTGTNPVDHPLIHSILGFMREGLTQQEMARRKGVKVSTIRVTIRRIQQAAGAFQQAKENRKRPGSSLDDRIRELRDKGLGGPAIARLIGMQCKFVYRRLEYMRPE